MLELSELSLVTRIPAVAIPPLTIIHKSPVEAITTDIEPVQALKAVLSIGDHASARHQQTPARQQHEKAGPQAQHLDLFA